MSVKEIEKALTELPPGELDAPLARMEECRADAWDKQIEDDLDSVRLDALLADVDKEYDAGLARPYTAAIKP